MQQYHVAISAEAFAAALFAQAGCEVSVQYGANQPGYDLVVARGDSHALVSVKGSKDGGWGLIQSFKNKGNSYFEAIDLWLKKHSRANLIFCLVQFKDTQFGDMPRIYLTKPEEMADYLKASRGKHGYTSLRERYIWQGGIAKGSVDTIPEAWCFTIARLEKLMPIDPTTTSAA